MAFFEYSYSSRAVEGRAEPPPALARERLGFTKDYERSTTSGVMIPKGGCEDAPVFSRERVLQTPISLALVIELTEALVPRDVRSLGRVHYAEGRDSVYRIRALKENGLVRGLHS